MDQPIQNLTLFTARPPFPYPGLRPFEPEEWSIFFGRETMIDDIIDRLGQARFVLIHGASGSGKSSLVRAGVLPKLARQHSRHGTAWLTCAMRPSGGPLWNLAAQLAALEGLGHDRSRITHIIRLFNRADATLSNTIAALDGLAGKRVCILVDQFEELFRFERETSREEAELFIDLLIGDTAGETRDPAGELHIMITMRSEFLGECARFDGLAEVINRTQYLVPPLSRADLIRAITQPALLFGGEVEPELVDRLIADVRGKPDELPLIQHGLMLFWHTRSQPGTTEKTVLTADLLQQAGGLAPLLSDHADRVMRATAASQERASAVEQLFRALTDINSEGQAIRRPQSFRQLLHVCGIEVAGLRAILDAFRTEGVSFLTPYAPAEIDDRTIIDISHEALIRCWKKISNGNAGWLRREFDDGLMWRSLLLQAREFEGDRKRVLSPATTPEREKWRAGKTPAWSERYDNNWLAVDNLLRASREQMVRSGRRRRLVMLPVLAMSAIAPPLILNGYTNEVQLEDVNKFDGLIIVLIGLIMTWTLLAMAGSLAMDIVRKTPIWRRRRSIAGAPATLRLQAKGRFRRVLSWCANIVRLTLRFWYGPALLFYLLGLFSVFRPWIDDPAAFEVRVGDSAYARADFGEALSWYAEAAERDNVRAKSKIVNMFQYNSALASATLYWVRRAAESGDAEAQTKMGDMYFYKTNGGPDYALAMAWYRKAADQDNPAAENNIGYMYHFALGVPQDYQTAMQWYLKAAAHDHAGAENNLGVLYMNGAGVAIDYHQAMIWFRKAARHGADNGRAKYHIGELYDRGLGVPKEPGLALDWMQKAAEDGDAAAKKWLELH